MSATVALRRARSTGTRVEVEDRSKPDAESGRDEGDDLRWGTICWGTEDDPHNGYASHPTLRLARAFAAAPEEWCPSCQGEDRDPYAP